MDMRIVNFIRKHGWPDKHGRMQYGNAGVLCYLSDTRSIGQMKLKDLDPEFLKPAEDFITKYLAKIA